MALAMAYVSEVLRQFDTDVLVEREDWGDLMRALKFDPSKTTCVLDRMRLFPVTDGFAGYQKMVDSLLAEHDRLKAKVKELEEAMARAAKDSEVHASSLT